MAQIPVALISPPKGSSPNAQNRPILIGAGPVRQDNLNPDAALEVTLFAPADRILQSVGSTGGPRLVQIGIRRSF